MARTAVIKPNFDRYPEPPETLSERGKTLWVSIVKQFRYDHFSVADLALLSEFCRCDEIIAECNEILRAEGLVIDLDGTKKPHPAVAIRAGEVRNMASLATKLRLPLSSRFRAEARSNDPVFSRPPPWADADGLDSLLA